MSEPGRGTELAERLVEALAAAARMGLAGELELSAVRTRSGASRFAGSKITQAAVVEDVIVRARVADRGRLGDARGNRLDAGSLVAIARRAAEVARITPVQPRFDHLPDPIPDADRGPAAAVGATARADADERAGRLLPVFAAAEEVGGTAAGVLETRHEELAVVSSRGVRAAHGRTAVRFEVIVSRARGAAQPLSAHASFYGPDLAALDGGGLAQRAADRVAHAEDPVELPPGEYDVVLGPVALAEALEWMAFASFGARSVLEGTSLVTGRRGEAVTGSPVTLYDDGLEEGDGATPLPFDGEGTPKRRTVLLDAGRCGGAVNDAATAAALGEPLTGHALHAAGDPASGPVPHNLFLSVDAGEETVDGEEELVARLERGLYVPRFHYVNGLLDPRRALTTGMTRDGAFLVDDGRPVRAIRNLRFTESLLEALARVDGATRVRRACAPHLLPGPVVLPAVLVRRFRFSGTG